MQSLICHAQKSFTTLEQAAAEKQMPVGSVDEFPLKPSHEHGLSKKLLQPLMKRLENQRLPPWCEKGPFQKQGQREGVWKKYKAKEGAKEQ